MDLDFEMLPPAPSACDRAVVAISIGPDAAVSATVDWFHPTGAVFVIVTADAGLGVPAARETVCQALAKARSAKGAWHEGEIARGPQFTTGTAFARRLSAALAHGNAEIVD